MRRPLRSRLIPAALAGALACLPPTFAVEVAITIALATPLFVVAMHGDGGASGATGGVRSPERLKTRGETPAPTCQRTFGAAGGRGIVADPLPPGGFECRVAQLYV
jgi:hypothetical protein